MNKWGLTNKGGQSARPVPGIFSDVRGPHHHETIHTLSHLKAACVLIIGRVEAYLRRKC